MISKEEKEFLLKSSKHIKTNHQFNSLEKKVDFSKSKIKLNNNRNKKVWFIGGGISGALLLAGAISLIVVFTGRYQSLVPLKSGEIQNFSSLKGFGVAGEEINQSAQSNRAKYAKNISERKVSNALDIDEVLYFSSPVNFYELTKDDNLKKADLKNEKGEGLNDYHVSLYLEGNDFIKTTLHSTKNLNLNRYDLKYSNTTTRNYFSFTHYEKNGTHVGYVGERGDINSDPTYYFGYNYLISKRTGKIYSSDNVLPGYIFGYDDYEDFSRIISFKDYEDGYLLRGLSEEKEEFDLFLAKEINNELEIKLVLNSSELRAFIGKDDYTFSELYIDRYGNLFYHDAAYINKRIVYDVRFDYLNRTIYKIDEEGYPCYLNKENEFIRTYERGRDVRSIKPFDSLTEEEQEEQNIYDTFCIFYGNGKHSIWNSNKVVYKKDNYVLTESFIKCTLLDQESEDDYREYRIEELPIAVDWWTAVIQNNSIYTLNNEKVYVLDINTLEYKEYDCGDNRINSLSVNSHGDIILKGYAKDELKEITAYIVDGEFTFEYKDIESDNLTYYVKPLN